jgi:hypothetical protein
MDRGRRSGEIAATITRLLGDDDAYCTGAILDAGGGR